MSKEKPEDKDESKDESIAEEFLEFFNAKDVIDHPGEPPREVESPVDDTDFPAPG